MCCGDVKITKKMRALEAASLQKKQISESKPEETKEAEEEIDVDALLDEIPVLSIPAGKG